MLEAFACRTLALPSRYLSRLIATIMKMQSPQPPALCQSIRKYSSGDWRLQDLSSTRQLCAEKSTSPQKMPSGPDSYAYTSGRWLHQNQLQQEARSLRFDFAALCKKVISLCPGAHEITSYEKKEGGFNRVFIFQMKNGVHIVARIPLRIAGPEMLTTHSEVATMAYSKPYPLQSLNQANLDIVRKNTDIPVPKVLEWNDQKTNAIGAEYIIMEHVPGVLLHSKWPQMNPVQHMRCVRGLAKMIKSMAILTFPVYGSIYFADAPIDSESKIPLGDFCIGPSCMREYWECIPGESRYCQQRKPNRGPCEFTFVYSD